MLSIPLPRLLAAAMLTIVGVTLASGTTWSLAADAVANSPDSAPVASATPSATPPASSGSVASLPSEVSAALSRLPPGTVIVPCTAAHPTLPGVHIERQLGFALREPGFYVLPDGYCANDPSATPLPSIAPVLDGPPGSTQRLP